MENLARDADAICILNCQDEKFLWKQLPDEKDEFSIWNKTSVGNSAQIILNAPTQELRNAYLRHLTEYAHWAAKQHKSSLRLSGKLVMSAVKQYIQTHQLTHPTRTPSTRSLMQS